MHTSRPRHLWILACGHTFLAMTVIVFSVTISALGRFLEAKGFWDWVAVLTRFGATSSCGSYIATARTEMGGEQLCPLVHPG